MRNQTIRWLAGVLLAQILIATAVYLWQREQQQPFTPSLLLQALDQSTLNRVVITDHDRSVTLEKTQDNWRLPDYDDLKAAPNKLSNLMHTILSMKTHWPTATTPSSHQRFELTEANFQRKIEIYSHNDLVETLYIGSSAAFKKSHLRKATDNHVYSAKLNAYDLPTEQHAWMDKGLLKVDAIQRIHYDAFDVTYHDDKWTLETTPKSEALASLTANQAVIETLQTTLANLQVGEWVTKPPSISTDYQVRFEVTTDRTLTYYLMQTQSQYFVKRSDTPQTFTLNQADYAKLLRVKELTQPMSTEASKTSS